MNSLEPHLMEEVISVHQTSEDIQKIYNKYVNLPQSYFEKHAVLGPCPIKQWNYSWNGRDFPRTWCVKDFIEWTSNYNLRNVKTLGYTSTNDPELEFINAERYIHLNYPPYDLHVRSPEFDNTFDFFIFNQETREDFSEEKNLSQFACVASKFEPSFRDLGTFLLDTKTMVDLIRKSEVSMPASDQHIEHTVNHYLQQVQCFHDTHNKLLSINESYPRKSYRNNPEALKEARKQSLIKFSSLEKMNSFLPQELRDEQI